MMDMDSNRGEDICRVCRSEAAPDRPLFHPCICTGSIKWIHQECLVQWMRYSRKEYCELCSHRFSFTPIYSPDMPRRLPLRDLLGGLLSSVLTAVKYWLHYTLVAFAWLGVVPLTACRIYRLLFYCSFETVIADLFSADSITSDIVHGCFVVTCTMVAFIGLVWLREQILHGGGPDWLERDMQQQQQQQAEGGAAANAPAAAAAAAGDENADALAVDGANQNGNPPIDAAMAMPPDDIPGIHAGAAGQHQPDGPPVAPNVADNVPGNNGDQLNAGEAAPIAANGGEENWIPVEWDRGAEELTWERLLGLDGSLVFLEHVLWVVSLNTLFILIFAFGPYHLGQLFVYLVHMQDTLQASHFEGLLLTMLGYCLTGMILVLLHRGAALVGWMEAKRFLGLGYVVVKVSILSVIEIGILPLVCGWWLDICSLAMFDASLRDRETSFRLAPGTSLFIHWLIGMVYVYYFASFILLLREILRPGVLWFLRNLNDPDFSPIQEMIHLPVIRHLRRLLMSTIVFGSAVMLMLWVPVRLVRWAWPGFLPYTVSLNTEAQVNELSLELLLLQVVLPALLEQSHTRNWLKALVRTWCRGVAWLLDLHSYLLGDADGHQSDPATPDGQPPAAVPAPPPPEPAVGPGIGLGAAHQALLMREGPTGFQPYTRPSFFAARIAALILIMCMSQVVSSLVVLTVPVWLGRRVMTLWLTDGGAAVATTATVASVTTAVTGATDAVATAATVAVAAGGAVLDAAANAVADANHINEGALDPAQILEGGHEEGETLDSIAATAAQSVVATATAAVRVHELYTAACGTYLCWLCARACALIISWLPQGRAAMMERVRYWCLIGVKMVVAGVVLLGIIPLLFGLLLELVVIVPMRVPIHQTPVMFLWQDWALGVLYTKIACAVTMMGPDWALRTAIEHVYGDGIRNMRITYVIRELATPVIMSSGLALAVPYVITHSIVPLFVQSVQMRNLISRRLYPFLLLLSIIVIIVTLQVRQFRKLYEHIKNDKYLVGQRLVNYDHRKSKEQQKTTAS